MSKPQPTVSLDQPNPTRVRYVVVGATALMAVLLYLDRFCISFAEIFIKEELNLTDIQVGWMLSAFFWTYALFQVPSGWLTDRFGARIMLTGYILLWSLFTGLTGLAFGFVMLIVLRLGFGFAQAGAYPTGANIVSKWVPFSGRGSASSVIALGGRVGGWLALFATGYLIVMFVPTSQSSLLESGDLLDTPRLCYELTYGNSVTKEIEDNGESNEEEREESVTGMHTLDWLSYSSRQDVLNTAEAYKLALEKEKQLPENEGKKDSERTPKVDAPPAAILDGLVTGINRALTQRYLFDDEQMKQLPIEKEARRILETPVEERTTQEVERLNRLVLESLYSKSIRKVYGAGWRQMMWTYGSLGLLVAALFWFCFRNRPEDHPWCNKPEVALIEHGRPASAPKPHGKVGGMPFMVPLLKSGSMWLICLSQWCTNVGWVFIVTWAPRYFQSAHHVPVETRALMVSIPLFAGWAGMLLGGRMTDLLVRVVGLRWGRALPMSLSRFTAMGAYIFCLFNPSPWAAVAAFCVVAFSTDLGTASVWAFKQDVGGRYVGSILGWGNMWGNLGAAVTAPLLIVIVTETTFLSSGDGGNWTLAFATCAAAFLIAGLACLGVNAEVPIAPRDEDASDGKD